MSLKDTLTDRGYTKVKIDRDAVIKGQPSVAVEVRREGLHGEFTFAKINHMSDTHIADVIDSYMKEKV